MKVKELVSKLENKNPDADVLLYTSEFGHMLDLRCVDTDKSGKEIILTDIKDEEET